MVTLQEIEVLIEKRKRTLDGAQCVIRCMDGRRVVSGDTVLAGDIAFPGALFGVAIDIFYGVRKVYPTASEKEFLSICSILQKLTGSALTYHTDTKHEEEGDFAIAGCGYCSGLVKDSKFLFSFIQTMVVNGHTPTVLLGAHHEVAVILINGANIDVTPDNGDGKPVFIIHESEWKRVLKEATELFHKEYQYVLPAAVSKEDLANEVMQFAESHLQAVVKKLEADKIPHYRWDGDTVTVAYQPTEEAVQQVA